MEILQGDLNLAQFPNLRKITFAHNLCDNSLENNNTLWDNCNLLVKESQLSQTIVCYYRIKNRQWTEERNLLKKKQTVIPCSLIEDRKLEQLEAENEQLKQEIVEKEYQIAELKKETEQTPTLSQFQELNNIALPTTELDFNDLKQEIQRLKLKDFTPYFQEQKDNLDKLVEATKSKVGDNLEMFLELCLQTQKQISGEEENDVLTQAQLKGQLTAYQTILQTKLNKKEVKNRLDKQDEFTHLEKQLKILEQIQEEQTEAQIEQTDSSSFFSKRS